MSYELPLYRQEKDNTCALACLRMVLAAFGTDVDETELEIQARLEIDGTGIGELERLARLFGLIARARRRTSSNFASCSRRGSSRSPTSIGPCSTCRLVREPSVRCERPGSTRSSRPASPPRS